MRISNNLVAMNTYRQYNINTSATNKSMEKLSSGSRINRAADDAAGLSISEKMRSQIRGLTQATRNAQDGISFLQTAEGALTEVSDMLVRLKELAVQAQNGTYNDFDRGNIGAEMRSLGSSITEVYGYTEFNGINVFGIDNDPGVGEIIPRADGYMVLGAFHGELSTVIKFGEEANLEVTISPALTTSLCYLTVQANEAPWDDHPPTDYQLSHINGIAVNVTVELVEDAITEVNTTRATYGAQQNHLEHAANNMAATKENLQAAESRIRDTDMADEMTNFTKKNILLQASQAMLAQANQQPQNILQILR